ncbi:Sex peptide receptor [Hypsibius exemplaris]|uniref:Sex peptide receptor n=1 Tax=Hypsibius exemplaris TaxID=2072580 RepID=A0A1W0X2L6_HYPEX|nr:Sex peptide receptor [Hypsibius exemplaris]
MDMELSLQYCMNSTFNQSTRAECCDAVMEDMWRMVRGENLTLGTGGGGGDSDLQQQIKSPYYNMTNLRDTNFSIPVYGYVTPFLLIITFFTNVVVVAVLSRPHMRSPSNFILCAMAVSDLCTLGIPVPMFVYQYTLGFHRNPVPCYLAVLDMIMTDILPTICHSASIWLTLMLAVQRYIYVCHPGKARIWCTIPRVTFGTAVIYTVSASYNLPRLFQNTVESAVAPWECQMVNQCSVELKKWAYSYLPVFFWFRIVCVNVLPCVLLVLLNSFLVKSLKEAQANRKRLFRERKQESSKQRDNNCTTMMLVAVVFVFLAVELPLACALVIFIIQQTWGVDIIPENIMHILILFSNLCIALSYSIYFPIYCSMSRQFRETFKELFIRAKQFTQDTRNGVRVGSKRRRTQLRNGGGCSENGTVFISTADNDDETFNRTVVAQVSGDTPANSDEGPAKENEAKESETLL